MWFKKLFLLAAYTNYTINGTVRLTDCSIVISTKCLLWGHTYNASSLWFFCLCEEPVTTAFQMAYQCSLIHSLPSQSLWKEEMRSSEHQIRCWNASSVTAPLSLHLQSQLLWLTAKIREDTAYILQDMRGSVDGSKCYYIMSQCCQMTSSTTQNSSPMPGC